MTSQTILNNVKRLVDTYGDRIRDDKKLLLAYWRTYDNVEMDAVNISVAGFMKATNPVVILDARFMLEMQQVN